MKIKRVMKKVVALGTGVTMVGATLLGALAAADLSQYPSPLFIKEGKFDGIIVVGDQAAGEDVVGAIDIAVSLQQASKTSTTVTGSTGVTTTVEGDAFKVEKSGDKLNLGEQLSGAGSRGGPVTVVDKSDLKALADGVITNAKGTFTYNQYIDMPDNSSVVYTIDSDQADDPALYLEFLDNYKVYTYRLSFPTALRSDIVTTSTAANVDHWKDLDNKKMTLMGKEYTVISTDNSTGTLTLMGGAILDTLSEGETKTYTINGVDYEVEVTIITGSDVLFKVNGEVTDKLQEGTTFKLKDGTEIGVKTLLSQDFAGGSRLVEFYLGASKVEIADSKFGAGGTNQGTLTVGSEEVSGVKADIVATTSAAEIRISKIEVMWNATDNVFVPASGKLSDRLTSDEKGKLFLQNLDFELAGVDFGTPEAINLRSGATTKYRVQMPTKTGGDLNFYAFYTNTDAVACNLGKDDSHKIITAIATPIRQNDQFIVSSNRFSHLLEVDSFTTGTTNKVKFKDLGTGDSFEVSTTSGAGTFYLDGYAYDFKADYTNSRLNITTSMGDDGAVLYTPGEAKVQIKDAGSSCIFNVTEYPGRSRDDSTSAVKAITVNVSRSGTTSSTPLQAGTPTSGDTYFSLQTWDSKNNFQTAYTSFGSYVEFDSNPDQHTISISYPGQEAVANAFVTSGVTTVVQAGTGAGTTTTYTPIQVGTAKLASEVSDITAQNMIVVGGPCANAIAAKVMGVEQAVPACLAGFSEGKAMLKLYEEGTKVAMLVAGGTALDTHRASRVLANYAQYKLTGTEVQVSGTSLTDITVTAVA
ncbi:MAG: hypothetical protein V1837_03950 [Candidatus Woesearchaeota archaeon]